MSGLHQTQRNKGSGDFSPAVNAPSFVARAVPKMERGKVIAVNDEAFKSKSAAARKACPCCGAELKNQRPHVDLNTNSLVVRGESIRLRPKHAKVLDVLLGVYPRTASHDFLIGQMWGDAEPEDARNNVKVFINQIRAVLAGTGVSIETVPGVGYRIDMGAKKGRG